MKKFYSFLIALLAILGLSSCVQTKTPTVNQTSTPGITQTQPVTPTPTPNKTPETPEVTPTPTPNIPATLNIQDGTILHAWNWSMKAIKDNMAAIKEAGYTAVQTSPMQTQKDYYSSSSWKDQWWKLYQPFGFDIATSNNAIGTKDDLIEMCKEAEKYGIKVIVDVVANHLAGDNTSKFSPKVKDYEPEIYNQNLIHNIGYSNDSSIQSVVQGTIGDFPDLKTESSVVQQEVLKLLKDYIDCGVDGFRFDAAKHIETPDDGMYASQFWPTVLNGASSYASSKGLDEPYYYGEILYTPGPGRSYKSYTKYMSITDNKTSKDVRDAVVSKNAEWAANYNYATGEAASKLVLWAESHDTYSNSEQESTNVSDSNITKAYAIVASRADATSLYFARPNTSNKLGEVGRSTWKNSTITEINKFHNSFVGSQEYLASGSGYFMNTRYNDENCGIAIVNLSGSNTVSNLAVNKMQNGQYIDQITGNTFTVSNGKISGKIGDSGIALIYNSVDSTAPRIVVDNTVTEFYDSLTVNVTVYNSTNSYYKINNGEKVSFNSSTKIDLSKQSIGNITITVYAENSEKNITKTYTFTKLDNSSIRNITITNLNSSYTSNKDVYAWVWKDGSEGKWVKCTVNGSSVTFQVDKDINNFLLASFNKGATPSWDLKPKQTDDQKLGSSNTYNGSNYNWK